MRLIIRMWSRLKGDRSEPKVKQVSSFLSVVDSAAYVESQRYFHPLALVKVVRVLDGDTIAIRDAEKDVRIRLFGIDCPEGGQAWGNRAKAGLNKLIENKMVYLEIHGVDKYERTLATIYVYNEGHLCNVNEKLVRDGHAWVYRKYYYTLPIDRKVRLTDLESWAKKNKVGLWKADNPVPPWQWRIQNSA